MRKIININKNWGFMKTHEVPDTFPAEWEKVDLPHTWNNVDGQDGGGDYFRGHAIYVKKILKESHYLKISMIC